VALKVFRGGAKLKFLRLIAIGLTLPAVTATAFGQKTTSPDQPDRFKAAVVRFGTGRSVIVKLTDRSTLKGKIGVIADDGFEIIGQKHHTTTTVPYAKETSITEANKRSSSHDLLTVAPLIGGVIGLVALFLRNGTY